MRMKIHLILRNFVSQSSQISALIATKTRNCSDKKEE